MFKRGLRAISSWYDWGSCGLWHSFRPSVIPKIGVLMDAFEILVSMTCLSVLIGIPLTVFFIKKTLKDIMELIPALILEQKAVLKHELEEWLNSEKGTKALYAIGALVAQGAKDSMPFISKGGKFKWQDLIGQIAGGAAKKFFGLNTTEPDQPPTSQALKVQTATPEA